MAVVFNAADGTLDTSGTVSVLNHTHTTAGTDRYLQVWVNSFDLTHTASTVTTNGNAMTRVGSVNNGNHRTELWHLANPPLGSNAIVATWSGAPSVFHLIAMSFTGVDQTTPAVLPNTEQTGTSVPSMSVASAGSGSLVASCLRPNADPGSITGTSTLRHTQGVDGIRVATTPGTGSNVTIAYTNSVLWSMFAVDVTPAAAGGRTTRNTRAWSLGVELGMGWRMPA